eukprot:363941-Chlamydomonas_euryale.AAC.18
MYGGGCVSLPPCLRTGLAFAAAPVAAADCRGKRTLPPFATKGAAWHCCDCRRGEGGPGWERVDPRGRSGRIGPKKGAVAAQLGTSKQSAALLHPTGPDQAAHLEWIG